MRIKRRKDCSSEQSRKGFTIVELLVVIVVIGILAAITIVSYTGITQKAVETVIVSDLTNSKNKLAIYYAENDSYPTVLTDNCPTSPVNDTNACIKPSSGVVFNYTANSGTGYSLKATYGSTSYTVSDSTSPTKLSSLAVTDPTNWIVIGNQVWAKANLNVGTMITAATNQTNNSTIEKYCYNDLESNCTTYGAFYQWHEAMQYTTTDGAQGVCPVGSHIPTDNEWKILEIQLGMTQALADSTGYRGTDQGTQLKVGGSSGLNIPIAGYRTVGGTTTNMSALATQWSSSMFDTNYAWRRNLFSSYTTVERTTEYKWIGLNVRCLGN